MKHIKILSLTIIVICLVTFLYSLTTHKQTDGQNLLTNNKDTEVDNSLNCENHAEKSFSGDFVISAEGGHTRITNNKSNFSHLFRGVLHKVQGGSADTIRIQGTAQSPSKMTDVFTDISISLVTYDSVCANVMSKNHAYYQKHNMIIGHIEDWSTPRRTFIKSGEYSLKDGVVVYWSLFKDNFSTELYSKGSKVRKEYFNLYTSQYRNPNLVYAIYTANLGEKPTNSEQDNFVQYSLENMDVGV